MQSASPAFVEQGCFSAEQGSAVALALLFMSGLNTEPDAYHLLYSCVK